MLYAEGVLLPPPRDTDGVTVCASCARTSDNAAKCSVACVLSRSSLVNAKNWPKGAYRHILAHPVDASIAADPLHPSWFDLTFKLRSSSYATSFIRELLNSDTIM